MRAAARIRTLRFALALALAAAPLYSQTVTRHARAVSTPFGLSAEIEVVTAADEEVDAIIAAAFERIRVVEGYTERAVTDQLSVDSIPAPTNAARDLFHVLERAKSFCEWSEAAVSPLAGRVYDLWSGATALPQPGATREAVESAGCDRLSLDPDGAMVQVSAGSRIDLRDFAPGFAVDAAVDLLAERGVTNARVRIGPIHRALGPGPAGRGWPAELPPGRVFGDNVKPIFLRDEALAVAGLRPTIRVAGDPYNAYVSARDGTPKSGVIAVLTITPHALDAQGLAAALYITGSHEGEMRLGVLKPTPAVLWLLGSPDGAPLIGSYRWWRRKTKSPSP